ncbi:MAG: DJ-1/PfpI family protein [Candidatus Krumholzibacteriia bacterium]
MSPPPDAPAQRRVLVPVGDGSEEIEAVTIIDVLRRAGAEVTVASVTGAHEVRCSRGVRLVTDVLVEDCRGDPWDLVVLPGGMPGAEALRDSSALTRLLHAHVAAGKELGAICAAPAVTLAPHGLLDGRRATCHPGFFDRLDPDRRSEERVVEDGPLVTSRGPGTALEFALTLVERLFGRARRDEVAGPMLPPT